MRRSLGLPVDTDGTTLNADTLLGTWSLAGAVWYAQACCSAGSNAGTSFEGLLQQDTLAFRVVDAGRPAGCRLGTAAGAASRCPESLAVVRRSC